MIYRPKHQTIRHPDNVASERYFDWIHRDVVIAGILVPNPRTARRPKHARGQDMVKRAQARRDQIPPGRRMV